MQRIMPTNGRKKAKINPVKLMINEMAGKMFRLKGLLVFETTCSWSTLVLTTLSSFLKARYCRDDHNDKKML